ncbi:hypothetical protein GCM10010361_10250 [Streptomyces olivaceiscleroticus]|uniref:Uncharacterized protein n=1 Tax=Streptomyces olivaceiscleroticus TaxID=68245 RepID=A0ABN0ZI92_9ACTN
MRGIVRGQGEGREVGVQRAGDPVDGGEAGIGLAEFDLGEHPAAHLGGLPQLLHTPPALLAQRADALADAGDELLRGTAVGGYLTAHNAQYSAQKSCQAPRVGNILPIMRMITSPHVPEQAVPAALREAFGSLAPSDASAPTQFVVDLPGGTTERQSR